MRGSAWLLAALAACTEYEVQPEPDDTTPPVTEPEPEAPVAIVGGGARIKRFEVFQLDGTASYDPDDADAELEYFWSLDAAPDGATWELDKDATARPKFAGDTLGTYQLSLAVVDADGLESAERAPAVIEVVPYEDLRISVSWDVAADVDVHLVKPGGSYYGEGDCFFGNPAPDWGVIGDATDDPLLSLDDDQGTGPEEIVLERPEEGTYAIYVTYWNDLGDGGSVKPTLTLEAEGTVLATVEGPTLSTEGRVWSAGTIDWTTLTYTTDDTVVTHSSLGGPTYND